MAGAAAIKWDASGTNPNPDAVEPVTSPPVEKQFMVILRFFMVPINNYNRC
jgi:hypothetical protein